MILIEIIFSLVLLCSFIGTITLIAFASSKNYKAKQLSTEALEKALVSNSKKNLEDVLIIHDKHLDKSVKQKIRARIDDMIIEDDESSQLENCKLQK